VPRKSKYLSTQLIRWRTMSISYPKKDSILAEHCVLLVTLGGSSASLDPDGDKISTFSKTFADQWNPKHPTNKVLSISGGATPFDSSRAATEEIIAIGNQMLSLSKKAPKLILIGKSMGGCKLHKVAERLDEEAVDIDLFIGVDMSCTPARHYDNYVNHGDDEKSFPGHVKSLVNFFQNRHGEMQCGHVALWKGAPSCKLAGSRSMCRDYNINVNDDFVRIGNNGEVLFEGTEKICDKPVGHMDIDSDPRLLAALATIIEKRVLAKIAG